MALFNILIVSSDGYLQTDIDLTDEEIEAFNKICSSLVPDSKYAPNIYVKNLSEIEAKKKESEEKKKKEEEKKREEKQKKLEAEKARLARSVWEEAFRKAEERKNKRLT